MTVAEAAAGIHALRPRAGAWVRVEQTRGSGERCCVCRSNVTRGFSFFENEHTSTAFVCDPCSIAVTEGRA